MGTGKYQRVGEKELGLRSYAVVLICGWTLVVLFSILLRINQESIAKFNVAREIARSHLEKDLILRDWNIKHDFVYAPVTPEHQPNPHLNLPEKEITTPSGKTLTAINSSSMIRQIYELAEKKLSYRGHLTSLKPLRPENAPDPWEQQALEHLDQGEPEVSEVVNKNGEPYFRLMHPLMATARCLACHSQTDYIPGKLAGGISVTLPMATVVGAWQKTRWAVVSAHGFLWLVGMVGIGLGARQLQKKIQAKQEIESALRQSEEKYRLLVNNIPALVYRGYADGRVDFIDDKVEKLTGYSQEQFPSGIIKWTDIILPEDRAGSKRIFIQALKTDLSYRREYRIRRKDGEIIWVVERSKIVCDAEGKIEFVSGVVLDISLQKELEYSLKESERFWKTLLEAVGVGLRINGYGQSKRAGYGGQSPGGCHVGLQAGTDPRPGKSAIYRLSPEAGAIPEKTRGARREGRRPIDNSQRNSHADMENGGAYSARRNELHHRELC
jgi:two-component system, chemotaxis family, sensor kinase Cph1